MRARAPARLMGLALLVLPVHVRAAVPAQLIRLEQQWLAALRTHNIGFLRSLLSKDYIDITYRGTIRDKSDALRASATRPRRDTQRLVEETVRLYGNTGIVTGRGILLDGARRRVAAWRFTDVFVRRGGAWQAVSSQETMQQR